MTPETIVIKYGGTSVGSLERFRATAESVAALQREGKRVIVVVSAMAGETDRLLKMGKEVHSAHQRDALRELDSLIATGEQVSAALLALALQKIGVTAQSFTAHQLGIATDGRYQRARIRNVDCSALLERLDAGAVCVVAGFQGTDDDGNVVTLGRGGSDTSAVAIAVATRASLCVISKDVDGIFTTDPRIVPSARKIDRLSYEEILELTSTGAKVLQMRSVEMAMKNQVRLSVISSFNNVSGTTIGPMNDNMEEPLVSGLSHDLGQAKVSIRGLPGRPESLTIALAPLAKDDISVDFVTQNIGDDGHMVVSFSLDEKLLEPALASLRRDLPSAQTSPAPGIEVQSGLAKVTAVGIGMRSHAGVAFRFFGALTRESIPIHMALSTEIKVSCLIPAADCSKALRTLHAEFFPASPS
ncbi:MAG: aspartate kinase [Verrucomicrobiales bacterium]|nr:aspartate kinase [Verrucomicrobiales bacterium]